MVANYDEITLSGLASNTQCTSEASPSSQTRNKTSNQTFEVGCFSHIWWALREQNIPHESCDIIMTSWRKSTQNSYSVYLKRWLNYTKARKINPVSPVALHIIAFLTQPFKQGIGYSALNTARSSINQFVSICSGNDFGSNKLIKKFMKGIFELKPALPKYTQIWDVQTVLHFMTTLPSDLSLIMLSGKLTVLFLLLTAQRCQTLHLIQLADIKFEENSMITALTLYQTTKFVTGPT